jgi:hypothetical protein
VSRSTFRMVVEATVASSPTDGLFQHRTFHEFSARVRCSRSPQKYRRATIKYQESGSWIRTTYEYIFASRSAHLIPDIATSAITPRGPSSSTAAVVSWPGRLRGASPCWPLPPRGHRAPPERHKRLLDPTKLTIPSGLAPAVAPAPRASLTPAKQPGVDAKAHRRANGWLVDAGRGKDVVLLGERVRELR